MNRATDEILLSSYIDGELSPEETDAVATALRTDTEMRTIALDMLETNARIKAMARQEQQEPLPPPLLESVYGGDRASSWRRPLHSKLLMAAMVVLTLLIGYGSGRLYQVEIAETQHTAPIYQIPDKYDHIVQTVLELSVSGVTREWRDKEMNVALSVTPIKTYRNKEGVFYRLYSLEIHSEKEQQKMRCLAFRNSDKHWTTQTIFFDDQQKKMI